MSSRANISNFSLLQEDAWADQDAYEAEELSYRHEQKIENLDVESSELEEEL